MLISPWYLALGWMLLYTAISLIAKHTNRVPEFLSVQGPITLIHTKYGRGFIDATARRFPRFWSLWGRIGVAAFGTGLIVGTLGLGWSAIRTVNQPESITLAKEPSNMLVIPGVNEYLPLSATPELVTALLIAMVIHEFGHAIYCRTGGIHIKSTGLALLGLIPIGAFVEPDEESQAKAPRIFRLRMVSAGVMNNLAAVVVALAILVLVVPSVIVPAPGVSVGGVLPQSPADESGLSAGDQLIAVNGHTITNQTEFNQHLTAAPDGTVSITTSSGETVTVDRRVFVSAAYVDGELSPGDTITHVDGARVQTTVEFTSYLDRTTNSIVTLSTSDGRTVQHVNGARVTVSQTSALYEQTSDTGQLFITQFNDERIRTAADLSAAFRQANAGTRVSVTGIAPGANTEFTTQYTIPSDNPGFAATTGNGGISVSEVGVTYYPAEDYLGFITAQGHTVWESLLLIVFLPFAKLSGLPYNFAGFTPAIENFYHVPGASKSVTRAALFSVSLAFWTVWVNVNLALFNCLPTYALDGGYYIRYAFEGIADRLGAENPKCASSVYGKVVMGLVLLGIVLIMVIPPVFG